MSAGAQVQFSFQVLIQAAAVGQVTNTGSVSTTDQDPDLADNSASAITTVLPSADLAISAITTSPAGPNYVGANLVYTITAVNNGLSDATGVFVIDTLPANVNFVSATGGVTPDAIGKAHVQCGQHARGPLGDVDHHGPADGRGGRGLADQYGLDFR